jgi:hypothetical protein
VPNPANPQSFNRFSYVYNNPVNYIDPSGHLPIIDEDEDGNPIVDTSWRPGDTLGGNSGDGLDNDDKDSRGCHTYNPCDVETNLYEVGWENFGQAWSIWINPNATTFQRAGAGHIWEHGEDSMRLEL